MSTASPLIVALDFADMASMEALVEKLDPSLCRLKVGKELFTRCGPAVIDLLHKRGFEVFLDLKFHDIPNTVAAAVQAAADMGVWMVNVHASGGARMMEAAREALANRQQAPLLIAVTVLTSMQGGDLQAVGLDCQPEQQVLRLATLTQQCGLDGVVCSAMEADMLRAASAADFKLVTPGIRPADAAADDQRRIVTPQQALQFGSDYLVIGRPITQHRQPLQALQAIHASLEEGK